MEDRCICCGEIIPEGMMTCPNCMVASKKKDVVEVGRCKGCYYYETSNPGHGYCKYFDTLRIDNDYCSSWERKGNA